MSSRHSHRSSGSGSSSHRSSGSTSSRSTTRSANARPSARSSARPASARPSSRSVRSTTDRSTDRSTARSTFRSTVSNGNTGRPARIYTPRDNFGSGVDFATQGVTAPGLRLGEQYRQLRLAQMKIGKMANKGEPGDGSKPVYKNYITANIQLVKKKVKKPASFTNGKKDEVKVEKQMDVDWVAMSKYIPWGSKPEDVERRAKLWALVDMNGNGLASLAEVDKLFNSDLKMPRDLMPKQVLIRAFNAAKDLNKEGSSKNEDYVDKKEFAALLQYIRQYLELWVMFDAIDTSDDNRIELNEFKKAQKELVVWGMKHLDSEEQMEAVFNKIDANGGGQILFDEFAHWAIKQNLDLEDDDDAENAGAGGGIINTQAIIEKKADEAK